VILFAVVIPETSFRVAAWIVKLSKWLFPMSRGTARKFLQNRFAYSNGFRKAVSEDAEQNQFHPLTALQP
jgi:hypothetical protein